MRVRLLTTALLAAGLLCGALAVDAGAAFRHNPVIFVHGFSGSGAQFESQKMRFTSNGYPGSYISVLEYDSLFVTESRDDVYARLDQHIADVKKQTGKAKVDLLGHSLGTTLMQEYLRSSPQRAANVAHYVNIDGRTADSPPGGVPTLAIWAGRGTPGRSIKGARNVTVPNQTHVQSATSAESFVEMFKFFTGSAPATSAIVPEPRRVSIAGRALLFPQNRGLTATEVQVWPIDRSTGHRSSSRPAATASVRGDGGWGPIRVEAGRYYELTAVRPGVATLHYYYEPFLRSDHLVRLLYNDAVEAAVGRSERHVALLVLRYKELWGDQGSQNDVLRLNGTSVCTAVICPIDKRVNAVFAYDRRLDGRTDLSEPDPIFSQLAFITGVDVFMPAARPPTGTVSVSLRSRGAGPVRTLRLPNFPSTTDGAVVQFNDFERPLASADLGCIDGRGRARGKRLGPARLGRSRSRQRRLLRGMRRLRTRRGMDRYCVAGGGSFRIGYRRSRAVLVLSSSPRFTVRGIRAGSSVRRLRRRLRGERRFRIGRNVWYLARGRAATLAFRARGRRVREAGIAARSLTRGRRASRRFVRRWELRR